MKHILLLVVCLLWACLQLKAQQIGIWYDTELQMTPQGKTNHVNLLYLSAEHQMGEHFQLSAATISIAKTRNESLIDDLQAFSNIEADNLPLALALAGLSWSPNEHHTLFAGIRSVTEDYFTSPVTALFTNSSSGIFPTLSYIEDIANYPLSALGVYYAYSRQSVNLIASLYNGLGHQDFTGRNSIWRFAPQSDGLFLITQADYTHQGSSYYLGACCHSGTSSCESSARSVLWTYTEQQVSPRLALIASLSHAFGQDCPCTDFAGLGAQYTKGKSTFGLFSDYARYRHDQEWATELTYKYDLSPITSLQTALHLVHHDTWQSVGLIRLSIRI